MPKTRPAYPQEFRREAIQMLRAGRTPSELAESLGVSQQTLRNWRRQDQLDRHERDDGLTSDEREELRRLRRENARLKQERDLLKRAAAFFAGRTSAGDRLPVHLGGEGPHPGLRGLRLLGVCRSGYYEWAATRAERSARSTDAWLIEHIREIHRRTAASTARRGSTPSCAWRTASASGASASSG